MIRTSYAGAVVLVLFAVIVYVTVSPASPMEGETSLVRVITGFTILILRADAIDVDE